MRKLFLLLVLAGFVFSLGTIEGTVFEDYDHDGIFDSEEQGMWKAEVVLKDGLTFDTIETAETNFTGGYVFDELESGVYEIVILVPSNYAVSTQKTKTLSISADDIVDVDFGLYSTFGKIVGTVFSDDNENGKKDGEEEGLKNVEVLLLDWNTEDEIESAETNENGNFEFSDLSVDTYIIRCTKLSADYEFTTESEFEKFVSEGETEIVEFGLFAESSETPSNISIIIFGDSNKSGLMESGEKGLYNVLVKLYDDNGNFVDMKRTNKWGEEEFEEISAGVYRLVEYDPTGFESTTPNEVEIILKPGQEITIYFGDISPADVSKLNEPEEAEETPEEIIPEPAEKIEENVTYVEIPQNITEEPEEEVVVNETILQEPEDIKEEITNTTYVEKSEEPEQEEGFSPVYAVGILALLAIAVYFVMGRNGKFSWKKK
ncbi:hypothetical protein JXB01_02660 [Candidatus Micrarchaeota archaeon]|nr:hypothetical protein [Candidatus Micrarchaeota archaeon]